ncbi:hypothetical protein ARMSODRAFT_1088596 [Armillaria solidipes]|uniref:Uncharacterized protein n=1 Tax=Armillaria solidipes TaxID=1076256 RepID=A0A2H3AX98_9AGAR|nr:hypothetical protein ARMSODRAFT_1088596 [Armillaria solidipes]
MSWPEQCVYCGFRESDFPSPIPPCDWVQGEDVFECLRSGKSTPDVDSSSVTEASLQNALTDWNHYLNHLDTLASRALKERAEIVKIIEAKQSLRSPVRRLNDDVLFIIFSYASDGTNNSLCMKNAPWTLLQTCHRWRRVVSSSPVLWSTLQLHLSRGATFPSHALDIVKLQLRLSETMPLKLFVVIDFDLRQYDTVISEVMSHSNQCYEGHTSSIMEDFRKFSRAFPIEAARCLNSGVRATLWGRPTPSLLMLLNSLHWASTVEVEFVPTFRRHQNDMWR